MRRLVFCALIACGGTRSASVQGPTPLPPSPRSESRVVPSPAALEGTYKLEFAATRPYFQQKIADRTPEEQERALRDFDRLENVDATFTLTADRVATASQRIEDSPDGERRKTTGTWRRDGAGFVATFDGKDMRCNVEVATVLCIDDKGQRFVLTRVTP